MISTSTCHSPATLLAAHLPACACHAAHRATLTGGCAAAATQPRRIDSAASAKQQHSSSSLKASRNVERGVAGVARVNAAATPAIIGAGPTWRGVNSADVTVQTPRRITAGDVMAAVRTRRSATCGNVAGGVLEGRFWSCERKFNSSPMGGEDGH